MKPFHIFLAICVATIWGLAYVATKIALGSFSPPQLTALRFLIACTPVLLLPRPNVPVHMLVAIGLTMFTGQFLLQFFGIANGMPPGLASVVSQTQGMFTVMLAMLVLKERPTARQLIGMISGLVGLAMIGLTVGNGLTIVGLLLVLASALSWSIGNVLLKRLPPVDMLHLMVWMSLVPPLPALAISGMTEGLSALPLALMTAPWQAIASTLYLGVVATVLAYAIWGKLLRTYTAAAVTPFALLAPCVGAVSSALVFGEQFTNLRLAGMAAILVGLAIVVVPLDKLATVCLPRLRTGKNTEIKVSKQS
ncbi:EamA family transporter [Pollutimonas bauzanensis]|uniref:O-acetylserine/cysteine efflux transporter n=1 Tax=Pollutimonas bauzanensis TaxID=658167 RepID=A0A1M5ZGZ2_9BURK|nr:EamA family transporter [Pollutimonas bauzanensis]SHI23193.1 O-acetylserine/cysteine efflux transporter [Pollutimonas bauzanensis]